MVEAVARPTARWAPAASAHSDSLTKVTSSVVINLSRSCRDIRQNGSPATSKSLCCSGPHQLGSGTMPSHAGSLRNRGRARPRSNLIWAFDRFSLCCLQPKTLNNHPVAADGVVVASELDIFSRDMNNPAERLRDQQNSMNSCQSMSARLNIDP